MKRLSFYQILLDSNLILFFLLLSYFAIYFLQSRKTPHLNLL
nr:MAG TPA_asm: hypothetical protein [Caudoviricetes sp.]